MPGRKPTALKRLHGTYRPDRASTNEPLPAAPVSLSPPRGMGASARAFWKRHAADLAGLGLLTSADLDSFRAMSECYGAMVDMASMMHAAGLLRRDDTGALKKSGAFLAFRDAVAMYRAWVGEFGLSPRARAALSVPVGDDGEVSLAELLFQSVAKDGDK